MAVETDPDLFIPHCRTVGCERVAVAQGFCRSCFDRIRKHTSDGHVKGALSDDEAAKIRKLYYRQFVGAMEIARRLNVSVSTVRRVLFGRHPGGG